DGLNGDMMTGVEVQCSPQFFDQLVVHDKVKEAFQNFQGNSNHNVNGELNRFNFGQVWFQRNNTTVGGQKFVDDYKAHAYPLGTMDTFEGTLSPADMTQYANTEGQRLYVSTKDLDHNKGVEVHMESRPTAFCKRLDSLVELSTPS
ncbi:MAG: major capsid protein, partial [Endozoicomonas sp.]